MKRSGLRRTAPLRTRTPLVGSTPMQRAAGLARRAVAAKRAKVTAAERAARKVLQARSLGRCEVCSRAPATNAHHRRKAGRVWSPENLLAVCGHGNLTGCHSIIELNPGRSREQGWIVPSHRNPADVPCWLAGREFAFLNPDGSITEISDEETA